MKILGFGIIILGIIGLIYGGFSYTRNKKILDLGGLEVRADQRERLPISPIAGGVAILAGVLLVVADKRRT